MYVFCCAAARIDGGIREDTLRSGTQLLLMLPLMSCEGGGVSLRIAQMSDSRQSRCPVIGCGVWKNNLSKRGSSSRRWYSVMSNHHLLNGQLNEALDPETCNDHICPNCYKRIRRHATAQRNLLDELTAAALNDNESGSPPPSPPTPPTSPPPPPPPSFPPPPMPPPVRHHDH